jgi:acyl-CoA hydrolase
MIEVDSILQIGVGGIPDAVAKALMSKRDFGLHTEMVSDGVVDLVE